MVNNVQKRILKIAVIFVYLIIALQLVTFLIRWDNYSLETLLYFSNTELEVHQISENPNILFTLKPNSTMIYPDVHTKENNFDKRIVSVNNLGFRGEEKSIEKPEDVFRIIVFGGSNTYGALVSDSFTYPAILERKLNNVSEQKFEVWNAGVSAHVLSQKVAYAEESIEKYNPDLIIIQIHNLGRRPFIYGGDFSQFFKKNKELYLENIPLLSSDDEEKQEKHYSKLQNSYLYREFMVKTLSMKVSKNCPQNLIDEDKLNHFCAKFFRRTKIMGDKISENYFDEYVKKQKITTLIFDPKGRNFCNNNDSFRGVEALSMCPVNKTEEYSEIHPPSYVYDWYADEIISYLIEENYINISAG